MGARPTRQTLQPEATEAGMEETKCLKPSAKRVTKYGDGASVQAVTQVNAEQASKCAVERRDHPVGDRPTRQLSLQPVAIGAVVEVTNRLKPSDSGSRIGDRASVQAAT